MSSGIHSSLHQNCHHQIIFAKFNLKVHHPPPYECEVWHFKKANTGHIKRAINGFPWKRYFANLDINDKVYLFNKTIKNILLNLWHRGVVVITTTQLHSTKPELRFCAGSNPAHGMSEIHDGEDLWQWSRLEIKLNAFHLSTIPQKQFIIIIIIIIIIIMIITAETRLG